MIKISECVKPSGAQGKEDVLDVNMIDSERMRIDPIVV